MSGWSIRFLGALLVAVSMNGYGSCGKDPECDDLEAWSAFTSFKLNMSYLGSGSEYRWSGEVDPKNYDILIHVDIKDKEPMKGDIGMIAGRVMVSRGLTLPRGAQIDSLDAPILMFQLSRKVLNRLFPGGPASIAGEQAFDRTFDIGVKYATPSAEAYIAPPWKVRGKAKRAKDVIAFDMSVTPAGEAGKTYTMKLQGELSTLTHAVFDDRMSLDGWKTYGVGVQVESQGGSTTYDYAAKPKASSDFATLGDLRAFIAKERAEEEYPGIKDPAREFTGFWKKKCEDAFGLQVIHHGSEGKYVMVFCGPGGCGNPDEERATFITGDKHYKVVSEEEIVMLSRSGGDDTYHRCTKDPHPVLKYAPRP